MERKELAKTILFAIPLAIGVALIVLHQLGEPATNLEMLLGVSIFCLALAGLLLIDTEKF